MGTASVTRAYHPWLGCRLKLLRAKDHIDALGNFAYTWGQSHPPTVTIEPKEGPGQDRVIRAHFEPFPAYAGLLVGDALHNLRSSLDHLAYLLALRGGGTIVGRPEFPIFRSKADFHRIDKRSGQPTGWSGLRKVAAWPEGARKVAEELQPYRHENPDAHGLWLLHELSNWDKHRTLHLMAVAMLARHAEVTPTDMVVSGVDFADEGFFEDNAVVARVRVAQSGPNAKVDVMLRAEVLIRLAYDGPAAGQFPHALLCRMWGYIATEVFPRFEPFFPPYP
jgi:hypothetical protein